MSDWRNLTVSLNITQRLSAYLPTAVADLIPSSFVQLIRSITKLPGQGDNLRNNKLSNTTRIAEGRVEYCNAVFGGILRVDLICAYAEAPNRDQILGLSKDPGCKLGLRAYANDVNISATISLELARPKRLMRYPTVYSLSAHPRATRTSDG